MNANTITLHINRLRETCLMDGTADEMAAFDAALPAYVARLTAAIPDGVSLEIDEHGTGSTRSLSDNDGNDLADELSGIDFWA